MSSPSPSRRSASPVAGGRAGGGGAAADIAATSKHRSLGHVEWSRQLSRATPVFFIPQPTQDLRGCSGADRPRKHITTIDLDKLPPRNSPAPPDQRDYTPTLYEDLHPKCGVSIGRAPARKTVFAGSTHNAETMVDAFMYPGWGKGKKSFLPKAARDTVGALGLRRWDTAQDHVPLEPPPPHSAYRKLQQAVPHDSCVTPDIKGGTFPKAVDKLSKDQQNLLDRPQLVIDRTSVEPHALTVNMAGYAARSKPPKESEKYRTMFQTPPPVPLSTHEPRRRAKGFAPMSHTFRNAVGDILRLAEADRKRAKLLMQVNAGSRYHSPLRAAMIYDRSQSGTPAAMGGDRGDVMRSTSSSPGN